MLMATKDEVCINGLGPAYLKGVVLATLSLADACPRATAVPNTTVGSYDLTERFPC
jgi:hypothetical protein